MVDFGFENALIPIGMQINLAHDFFSPLADVFDVLPKFTASRNWTAW
jgi:hypothetical protein